MFLTKRELKLIQQDNENASMADLENLFPKDDNGEDKPVNEQE